MQAIRVDDEWVDEGAIVFEEGRALVRVVDRSGITMVPFGDVIELTEEHSGKRYQTLTGSRPRRRLVSEWEPVDGD